MCSAQSQSPAVIASSKLRQKLTKAYKQELAQYQELHTEVSTDAATWRNTLSGL